MHSCASTSCGPDLCSNYSTNRFARCSCHQFSCRCPSFTSAAFARAAPRFARPAWSPSGRHIAPGPPSGAPSNAAGCPAGRHAARAPRGFERRAACGASAADARAAAGARGRDAASRAASATGTGGEDATGTGANAHTGRERWRMAAVSSAFLGMNGMSFPWLGWGISVSNSRGIGLCFWSMARRGRCWEGHPRIIKSSRAKSKWKYLSQVKESGRMDSEDSWLSEQSPTEPPELTSMFFTSVGHKM